MKTIVAKWPDETFSVLRVPADADVFEELDQEGDPYEAEVYVLSSGTVHMGWQRDGDALVPQMYAGKCERITFPPRQIP